MTDPYRTPIPRHVAFSPLPRSREALHPVTHALVRGAGTLLWFTIGSTFGMAVATLWHWHKGTLSHWCNGSRYPWWPTAVTFLAGALSTTFLMLFALHIERTIRKGAAT
jgi:hypothetical protein